MSQSVAAVNQDIHRENAVHIEVVVDGDRPLPRHGLIKKAEGAKTAARRARERADESVMTVVQTFEVAGTGFTLGAINGRFGGVEVVGVPLDLLSGASLHLLGMFMSRRAGEHLHNFGDGALCSWATVTGIGIGREMATRGGAASGGGYLPGGRSPGVSEENLRSWANAA